MEPIKVLDLGKLLEYFDRIQDCMNRIFPEKITWENVYDYHYDLGDLKHPDWVKKHFPLILIYHREKAGKLRKARKESTMYQNNYNVLTQFIGSADAFGLHHRKNKHKGWKNIVAGIQATQEDSVGSWADQQPSQKFKNFEELFRLKDPSSLYLKCMCEVLSENYKCDSEGQLRLL